MGQVCCCLLHDDEGDQLHRLFRTVDEAVGVAVAGGADVTGVEKDLLAVVVEHGFAFDDVVKYFKAVISKAPGAKTSIKLVGTKKDSGIYAALPNALGTKLLDDGTWDVYPIRAFGENLAFTNYEKKKKEEYENAKPSSAPSKKNENPDTLGVDSTEEDIDYDSLL